MKILGTGLTGLVGSRIVELLDTKYEFEPISSKEGYNIVDSRAIQDKISSSSASVVLHLAAKTNVDGCELDKEYDRKYTKTETTRGTESAWEVNVIGTRNIAEACKKAGKKLIYVSTDFVFDGQKSLQAGYTEEDLPGPVNWYGKTKYEGEKAVRNILNDWIIARIAYPYRSSFVRKGFVRAIFEKLQSNEPILGVTDHIMTPTFIDDIAFALDTLIQKQARGIYHVVGSQFLAPYEVAQLIAKKFHFDQSLVQKTTRAEYFKNKAIRPFQLAIRNDKIRKLYIEMSTFEKGLNALKLK